MRWAAAVLALCAVGGSAAAETRVAAAEPKPDTIADEESAEANLETKAPRDGLTFTFAVGAGLLLGGDVGIGRGGALSARIGHVATRRTVITFELSGTGALHKRGSDGTVATDSNAGLYAGALRYAGTSTWVRAAGGLTVFTANARTEDVSSRTGIGALIGGGLDLVRWGYVVLGFEVFGMASVTGDGFKVNTGFCLGLSYY